jgi:DNA polymerase-4
MPIARAARLCPNAMFVPVPGKACSQKHREIRGILERFTPLVSGASIDEWYMDLGGTEGIYHNEPLRTTAHRIRQTVRDETGLSVSIGGGTNRLVAKMAVERAKPKPGTNADGVHIVEPGTEEEFMRGFDLADIPMIGPKSQERLAKLGMRTVPDVLQYDLPALKQWLSEREALWLWDRVHGRGSSEVESPVHGEQKSMSRDETFPVDLDDDADLEHELVALVTRVAFDLRQDGMAARTIVVKIRDRDFRTRSMRKTLIEPVVSDRVILRVARELLAKLRQARRMPARLLGVALSSLTEDPEADQLKLFRARGEHSGETERDRTLAKAVDKVRDKFGRKGILPASLTKES